MRGNKFCQRYGEIKAQGKVAVAFRESVDLLFGFAAALGEKHFGGLNNGRIQRCEAVGGICLAQKGEHTLKLQLIGWQQLHKAGERARCNNGHKNIPFG